MTDNPTPNALPSILPLFPVNGMMLLPRVQVHLSLSGQMNRALVDDALRSHRTIGIIQPKTLDGPMPDLYHIGTAARINFWMEQDDGDYVVGVVGLSRFRLLEDSQVGKPYRQGRVNYEGFAEDLNPLENYHFERRSLLGPLSDFFVDNNMELNLDAVERTPDSILVNTLSMICPFDVAEKQALLEAPTVEKRLQTLETILAFATTPASPAKGRWVH